MRSDRLEDANYCILGTLFRTKNESYETLPSHVGMTTSKHRRYYQALVLIYKCLNSTGPKPYIAEFLSIRDVCYNLGGKGSNLFQPHFNNEWRHKSFSFSTSKLWNKLPLYIRKSENLKMFKQAFQSFNLEYLY